MPDRAPGRPRLEPRGRRLERLESAAFDVVVVGGGITGAGCALDLALRGARVALIERGDWAQATSSASSRLVHGGLRYLEHHEWGLVRESCRERRLLLENAAPLVWPERFIFPLRHGDRLGPARLAAGLWLYTLLSLPRPMGRPARLGCGELAAALPGIDVARFRAAGSYLDGATDDARLTLAVVLSAARAGAVVASRLEATSVEQGAGGARITVRDLEAAAGTFALRARAVVLAAGPFTDELRARAGWQDAAAAPWLAPTRGTHLLVPRERLPLAAAAIFTSPVDGRVMFLLPRVLHTAIGTTDVDARPGEPLQATRVEVRYLLDSANGLIAGARLREADVLAATAGLRPLLSAAGRAPSARSREHRLERQGALYCVAGGKLTGYRQMAEEVGAEVSAGLGAAAPARRSPTRRHPLRYACAPGAGRPSGVTSATGPTDVTGAAADPWHAALLRRYGSAAAEVERTACAAPDGLLALDPETRLGEVDWAVHEEDCLDPADFLLRRTDCGLQRDPQAESAFLRVAERMAALLSWSPERRATARQRWDAERGLLHGWRHEPGG